MICIKDKIENAFEQISIQRLIKGWSYRVERLILVCWIIIPISLVLWAWLSVSTNLYGWIIPVCVLWIFLGPVIGSLVFNSFIKKSLVQIGIKPTPGLFAFWVNSEFREYKLGEFYKVMCSKDLLTDTEKDIELTEQYLRYFEQEATDSFKTVKFIFGGTILAFCLPVWNQYLIWLFKNTSEEGISLVAVKCTAIILLIASSLIASSLFYSFFTDYSNKTSKKFKDISKLLKELHLNLKLKY